MELMRAEIVSVGTEILLGQIVDTNAAYLGEMLAELGIAHTHRQTVGDNLERLTEALRQALSRADVVFTIGGLGPTQDDLTRDGIAAALGEELIHDPALEAGLRAWFEGRKLPWVESLSRQATRPPSAEPVENKSGTAPGLICRKGGKTVIALPGPRSEFIPMAAGPVRQALAEMGDGGVIHSLVLRIAGIGESWVEERIKDLIEAESPTVAPYAKPAEVHLRITARAQNIPDAEAIIAPVAAEIRARLGDAVYATGETTLEETILSLLTDRGETLAVAESCTGGGLGRRLTSVSGASRAFVGGVISYSNELKCALLGVPEALLAEHGAVSEEVASAMAVGATKLGATWGVAITGIAGPEGGTDDKPVGLVFVSVAGPSGVRVDEHRFRGRREDVRERAIQMALIALRNRLLGP